MQVRWLRKALRNLEQAHAYIAKYSKFRLRKTEPNHSLYLVLSHKVISTEIVVKVCEGSDSWLRIIVQAIIHLL
jgi:hypothetical protein